jgi:hypothetical protein
MHVWESSKIAHIESQRRDAEKVTWISGGPMSFKLMWSGRRLIATCGECWILGV